MVGQVLKMWTKIKPNDPAYRTCPSCLDGELERFVLTDEGGYQQYVVAERCAGYAFKKACGWQFIYLLELEGLLTA